MHDVGWALEKQLAEAPRPARIAPGGRTEAGDLDPGPLEVRDQRALLRDHICRGVLEVSAVDCGRACCEQSLGSAGPQTLREPQDAHQSSSRSPSEGAHPSGTAGARRSIARVVMIGPWRGRGMAPRMVGTAST